MTNMSTRNHVPSTLTLNWTITVMLVWMILHATAIHSHSVACMIPGQHTDNIPQHYSTTTLPIQQNGVSSNAVDSVSLTIPIRLLHPHLASSFSCAAHVAAWNQSQPSMQQQSAQPSPWILIWSIPLPAEFSILRLSSTHSQADQPSDSNSRSIQTPIHGQTHVQINQKWLVQVHCRTSLGHRLTVEPSHGIVVSADSSTGIHSFRILDDDHLVRTSCNSPTATTTVNCPSHPPWIAEWQRWLSALNLMEDLLSWPALRFMQQGLDILSPFNKMRAVLHDHALTNIQSSLHSILHSARCNLRMIVFSFSPVIISWSKLWTILFITLIHLLIATVLLYQQLYVVDQVTIDEIQTSASPHARLQASSKEIEVGDQSASHERTLSLIQDTDRTRFDDLHSGNKALALSTPQEGSQEYDEVAPNI